MTPLVLASFLVVGRFRAPIPEPDPVVTLFVGGWYDGGKEYVCYSKQVGEMECFGAPVLETTVNAVKVMIEGER